MLNYAGKYNYESNYEWQGGLKVLLGAVNSQYRDRWQWGVGEDSEINVLSTCMALLIHLWDLAGADTTLRRKMLQRFKLALTVRAFLTKKLFSNVEVVIW